MTNLKQPKSSLWQRLRGREWIVHQNWSPKIAWDWMLLVATFYVGVVTPYNAVFLAQEVTAMIEVEVGEILIDILFIVDIFIRFRTTYFDRTGKEITDSKLMVKNYVLGWFWIDLIAAVPYDLFKFKAILLIKCVRLLRLLRILNIIERYSQYSSVILTVNMVTYILFAHWFACVWYIIGNDEYENRTTDWNQGWLYNLDRWGPRSWAINKPKSGSLSPDQRYWTALYFSLTLLTTVGFGNESANSVPEKIAVCVAMPIFALMHAVVFGNVTAIIQRMYARRFAYDLMFTELKDFCKIYSFPRKLKNKMLSFTQTMWTANRGISYHKLVSEFPDEMRAEIYLHIFSDFLSTQLFTGAPIGCIKSISLQMRDNFLTEKDVLISKGDNLRSIYYIASGNVIVSKDGREILTLGLSYALSLYPEFKEIFMDRITNCLTFDLAETYAEDKTSETSFLPFMALNNGRIVNNPTYVGELPSNGNHETPQSLPFSNNGDHQNDNENMAELAFRLNNDGDQQQSSAAKNGWQQNNDNITNNDTSTSSSAKDISSSSAAAAADPFSSTIPLTQEMMSPSAAAATTTTSNIPNDDEQQLLKRELGKLRGEMEAMSRSLQQVLDCLQSNNIFKERSLYEQSNVRF